MPHKDSPHWPGWSVKNMVIVTAALGVFTLLGLMTTHQHGKYIYSQVVPIKAPQDVHAFPEIQGTTTLMMWPSWSSSIFTQTHYYSSTTSAPHRQTTKLRQNNVAPTNITQTNSTEGKVTLPKITLPKVASTYLIPTNLTQAQLNSKIPNFAMTETKPWNSSHIVFIKTHKAASSTVQALFLRYGMKHNLTFVLPSKNSRVNQLGWPYEFSSGLYDKTKFPQPDVLCLHSVLSRFMIKMMPADSVYITIVRDPFTQIKSSYKYYGVKKCIKGKTTPLMDLIKAKTQKCLGSVINNPQMFDLGMSFLDMTNSQKVEMKMKELDKQFHLVMVMEYIDESLILLRDLLGWTNDDILYFKVNFNGKSVDSKADAADKALVPEDNPTNRAKVYEWLKADLMLYTHFKIKLEKIIAQKRAYIDKELVKFRNLQKQWVDYCVESSLPSSMIKDKRFRPYGAGSHGYILTEQGYKNSSCVDLAIVEVERVTMAKQYQSLL